MRELLEAVAAGEVSPAEAEARIAGYATGDAGRFDAARETRRGVPEAILGDGKTPEEVAALAETAVETTGRAIVTRTDDDQRRAIRQRLANRSDAEPDRSGVETDGTEVDVTTHERSRVVVAHGADFAPPDLDATVGVVTAGTSDAVPAGEAALLAEEMGATVERIEDVGVAALTRIVDQLDRLRNADVLVVAAGREGALPTVVAGLVDTPVVGLPVSTGYGYGGEGEAALAGMLQSCSVLSVVNVDAGFVAGAQAGLVASAIDGGSGNDESRGGERTADGE